MNVCLISRESPWGEHTGGIGTYVGTVSLLLSQSGANVHVITCASSGRADSDTYRPGANITVHFISPSPYLLPGHKYLYWYRRFCRKMFPQYLSAQSWAFAANNFYEKLAAAQGFDFVEYPETMGEGFFFKKKKAEKFVCRIHSSSMLNIGSNYLEKKRILKIQKDTCNKSDLIVSPSQFVKMHYAIQSLHLKTAVSVKSNPYVANISKIHWERKNILNLAFAGRLEFRKGFQFLLNALNCISDRKLILDVFGSKHRPKDKLDWKLHEIVTHFLGHHFPLEFKILKNPISFGLNGHVIRFWGQLSQSQLQEKLLEAYLFILPSLSENYPYVLLEAMDSGCLCIASKTGGIPEVLVHSPCSLQFEPGNHMELARGISHAVDKHDDFISKLKNEKKMFNEKFNAKYQTALMQDIFSYAE